MGRPIQGLSKKDHKLQIRMNDEELQLLDACAAAMGTTRTAVVNEGIRLVKAKLDAEK